MVIFPLAPDQTIARMWSNGARGGLIMDGSNDIFHSNRLLYGSHCGHVAGWPVTTGTKLINSFSWKEHCEYFTVLTSDEFNRPRLLVCCVFEEANKIFISWTAALLKIFLFSASLDNFFYKNMFLSYITCHFNAICSSFCQIYSVHVAVLCSELLISECFTKYISK